MQLVNGPASLWDDIAYRIAHTAIMMASKVLMFFFFINQQDFNVILIHGGNLETRLMLMTINFTNGLQYIINNTPTRAVALFSSSWKTSAAVTKPLSIKVSIFCWRGRPLHPYCNRYWTFSSGCFYEVFLWQRDFKEFSCKN